MKRNGKKKKSILAELKEMIQEIKSQIHFHHKKLTPIPVHAPRSKRHR